MKQTMPVILQFRQQRANLQHTGTGEQYQVDIVQAPGRGWGGPMLGAGMDETHLQIIRDTYRNSLERQLTDSEAGGWTLHPLRLLGNKLFRALPKSVQARLQAAQALAQAQGRNLAIILIFEQSASSLLDLPWELLHDPDGRFFYSLRGGGLSRRLLLPTAVPLPTPYKPQQILGLWAEPPEIVEPLSVRRQHGPAPGKPGSITWLHGPDSLGQLKRALADHDVESLHITAHGRVGSRADFALALEEKNGRINWFGPQQLAHLLGNYPTVRFVYLDVCGAGTDQTFAQEPEPIYLEPGGAAPALLGTGVTAVIVMQDVVGQAAAGVLADIFYLEVSSGETVAVALTQARRAVQLQLNDTIHWSVPALYMQQQPLVEEKAPIADWILDHVAKPGLGKQMLFVGVLLLLVGRISLTMARFPLEANTMRPFQFSAAILSSSLIPLLAAFVTRQGEKKLTATYNLTGHDWRAFLINKYFAAFTWSMMGWFILAGIWLTLAWSGIIGYLDSFGRQLIWAGGLLGLAVMAHTGARQSIRQALLFRRVGVVSMQVTLLNLFVILMLALVMPLLIMGLLVAAVLWLKSL